MGGQVLARRWRCREGELDLVVALGDMLVFAEVKARPTREAALHALDPAGVDRIGRAALRYIASAPHLAGSDMRIDLVIVTPDSPPEVVENIGMA